jgi:hypothetical protein
MRPGIQRAGIKLKAIRTAERDRRPRVSLTVRPPSQSNSLCDSQDAERFDRVELQCRSALVSGSLDWLLPEVIVANQLTSNAFVRS